MREIQALRRLSPHEHVVTLEEVLYDQPTGRLALVFELMDGNLYEIIKGRKHYLNPQLIKGYMWQLMKSLDHMHKKGIFHRDIKPENILVDSTAEAGLGLKLADFGSCRGIYSKQPYTEYISTRWYRAPECLLTDGYYGPEMDMWGAGCVMFEITTLFPLFPGANEADQIARIHKIIGTKAESLEKLKAKGASHISFKFPPEKGTGVLEHLKHASPDAQDLIQRMLKYDASERISAREAMVHPYFKDMRERDRVKSEQQALALAQAQAHKEQQQQQHHAASGSTASKFTESMTVTQSAVSNNTAITNGKTSKQLSQLQKQLSGKNVHDSSSNNNNKGSLMPISGPSSLNKALPNINADSNVNEVVHGHKAVQQQSQYQHQHQHQKYPTQKQVTTNQYHMTQGNDSSLPPIGGPGGGGTLNGSKLKQSGGGNAAAALSVNGGGSGIHSQNSQYAGSNAAANNVQKKRKKYRLNYGAQENRNNANNILKAYGLNNNNGGGAR